MKKEELFEAIGDIDDDIIEGEERNMKKRKALIIAAAACAVLALLAFPVMNALRSSKGRLHSYNLADMQTIVVTTDESMSITDTMGEITEPAIDDSGELSQSDDYTGAFTGEKIPVTNQNGAIKAYENLINYFTAQYGEDNYPDWYAGAYLEGSMLIVNVTTQYADDKEFLIQIEKWADSTAVGFGERKYSYNELRAIMEKVCDLLQKKNYSSWGCGIYDMEGVVGLTVPTADEELLSELAKIDPDDDAVVIEVGEIVNYDEAAAVDAVKTETAYTSAANAG